jgi:hypothetical protein
MRPFRYPLKTLDSVAYSVRCCCLQRYYIGWLIRPWAFVVDVQQDMSVQLSS